MAITLDRRADGVGRLAPPGPRTRSSPRSRSSGAPASSWPGSSSRPGVARPVETAGARLAGGRARRRSPGALDPQRQRADPAQAEEDLEWPGTAPVIARRSISVSRARLVAGDDDPEQRVGVPGEVLGRRVDDESAPSSSERCSSGVARVASTASRRAALVRGSGERRQVGDPDQRVVRRLSPDEVGLADRGDRRLGVGLVDEGDLERAERGALARAACAPRA